jgi:3-oxoadipate enol-lactonase
MPTIHNNGQQLAYEDTGGSGSVVVFNHSFGMNGSMFASQINAFREQYRCISWDQRAHGSSFTDHAFTFWDSAKDCITILDHLGIKSASLVGVSQGGFVSMRAALLAPGRVASIAIFGSSATAESEAQKAAFLEMYSVFVGAAPKGPPDELLISLRRTGLARVQCRGLEADLARMAGTAGAPRAPGVSETGRLG